MCTYVSVSEMYQNVPVVFEHVFSLLSNTLEDEPSVELCSLSGLPSKAVLGRLPRPWTALYCFVFQKGSADKSVGYVLVEIKPFCSLLIITLLLSVSGCEEGSLPLG